LASTQKWELAPFGITIAKWRFNRLILIKNDRSGIDEYCMPEVGSALSELMGMIGDFEAC